MAKDTLVQTFATEELRHRELGEFWAIWRKVLIPLTLLLVGGFIHLLGSPPLVTGIVIGLMVGPLVIGDKIIILLKLRRRQSQH
jgi:hypothetical protein